MVEEDNEEESATARDGDTSAVDDDDEEMAIGEKRSGEILVAVSFKDSTTHDFLPQEHTTTRVPSLAVTVCWRTRAATLW